MSLPNFIILLFTLIQFEIGSCAEPLTLDGQIILGGLFPLHKKSNVSENQCGEFNEIPGYQYMEAMLFAIDEVNKDPILLKNITLGARIYDTCQSKTIAANCAKEFIKMTIHNEHGTGQLAGVLGALSSGVSETVANFLRVFEIPQISYSSTSVTLSNKDIYSYFLRTVAPDSFQAQAMVDIIRHFGWSYVSAINSDGTYGTKGMEIFLKKAEMSDTCIDYHAKLSPFPTDSECEDVVASIVKGAIGTNVSVVVLFCTQNDLIKILKAATNIAGAERLTWLGSDGWSNRIDVTRSTPEAARGALTIIVRRGDISEEYVKYFKSLNWTSYPYSNKRFFKGFWELRFNCSPNITNAKKPCQGNESLANLDIDFSPVRVVINAVYAFAHALNSLQEEMCPNETGLCRNMSEFKRPRLLEHLKNVTFDDPSLNTIIKFDKNGEVKAMYDIMNFQKVGDDYKYVHVGGWDGELVEGNIISKFKLNNISWLKSSSKRPTSFCTNDCKLGAVRSVVPGKDFACCWNCQDCEKLQIVVNNTCQDGPEGWVPDVNRTGWIKRQVIHPRWGDSPSVLLVVITVVCLALTVFTSVIYIIYNKHRIVKASGRELCYVMLAGIGLCFIVPFLFLGKPNDPLCYARSLVSGVALAMCYAPLFMKINRIYRIFTNAKSTAARPSLVTPRMQVLVTFGLVFIQLMFTTLWFVAKPVHSIEKYYSKEEKLILECEVDQLSYSVNLCYVIVLMILCTVYAFKTRNFPKNFNESKYIGITMYITCAIWIAFFPFYLNTDNSFTHAYLISGACVLVGFVTLTGLFAQKIYIIFFVGDIQNNDLVITSSHKRSITKTEKQCSPVNDEDRQTSV